MYKVTEFKKTMHNFNMLTLMLTSQYAIAKRLKSNPKIPAVTR